jgi:hypothetical protein
MLSFRFSWDIWEEIQVGMCNFYLKIKEKAWARDVNLVYDVYTLSCKVKVMDEIA